jgi:twitching motility two-component system response regulator PilG
MAMFMPNDPLVKQLTKEVIIAFLSVQEGIYKLIQDDQFNRLPKFCCLDIRSFIESYQSQRLNQSGRKQAFESSPPTVNFFNPELISSEQLTSTEKIEAPKPPQTSSLKKDKEPQQPQQKKKYSIACIDDSPTVLRQIRTFLGEENFLVFTIENSINAPLKIIHNNPDLILLDVTMPNLDGYELCSLLRKHRNFKRTPIVMVTSNARLIDRAKAKLVGASGYLTKPFTQADLVKTVFMYLH